MRAPWLACLMMIPGLAAGEGAVVATVAADGHRIEITAERLEAWLAEHPGARAAEGVEALTTFELLALKAEAGGYADHTAVRGEVMPTLVDRYLKEDFEARIKPGQLPERYLREAYQSRRAYFKHPEIREAVHVVFTVGGKLPEDPERLAAMRQLCEAARGDLAASPPESAEDFLKRAAAFAPNAEAEGFEARAEDLGGFTSPGRYDKGFTDAAFALKAPGDLSDPVMTRFGCHVIRLGEITPPRDDDYEAALPELETRLLDLIRAEELKALIAAEAEAVGVERFQAP